jgi:predicted RNA-binding protein (virulence factor B family)
MEENNMVDESSGNIGSSQVVEKERVGAFDNWGIQSPR